MKPADRMMHLAPHFFATLNDRLATLQAEGRDIIRLDEGAPDLPPAPHIIDALIRAASRPDSHSYQPHRGPDSLRMAWSHWYKSQFEVELDPQTEIIPLLGSKEGIFHLNQAIVELGDLTLVPDPGYVTYTRGALFAGAHVKHFPLLTELGYLPDLRAIASEVLQRAKILWLNYPNNPTAATATLRFFEQAVALAREFGILLCHDAAYVHVTLEGQHLPSLLQIPGAKEVAVEFNTLSKSHNMAGWRTGALLGNPDVVRTLFTLKTNADSSHFLPIFEASVAALNGDQTWIERRNEVYRQRRDVVIAGLEEMGFSVRIPEASLYVWAPTPEGWDCEQFATAALEGAGVSMTPGTVFGSGGDGFVRISLTAPIERLQQAMQRMGNWYSSKKASL